MDPTLSSPRVMPIRRTTQWLPPQTQKGDARTIAFVLDDQTVAGSTPVAVSLAVRPEELTRQEVSRVQVHHAFGGAFADSFGAGVATVSINGHTGWRPTVNSGGHKDGQSRFTDLHDKVFQGWQEKRLQALQRGSDPDGVQLIFADSLDGYAVVVAPQSFGLRRSRSRPLLLQFQIALTVLDANIDSLPYLALALSSQSKQPGADSSYLAGLATLADSIGKLTGLDLTGVLSGGLLRSVTSFVEKTAGVFSSVMSAAASVSGVGRSLMSLATTAAQAGMNVFRSIVAVVQLPSRIACQLMQIASEYSNVFCVLKNALSAKSWSLDCSPLYGASNCSSTNGGSPPSLLAGLNPFYLLSNVAPELHKMSTDGREALDALARTDVVLSPPPIASLGALVSAASAGLHPV